MKMLKNRFEWYLPLYDISVKLINILGTVKRFYWGKKILLKMKYILIPTLLFKELWQHSVLCIIMFSDIDNILLDDLLLWMHLTYQIVRDIVENFLF